MRHSKLQTALDEKTLSSAMSGSLPPVSSTMIQQVGDAMREMEQDRNALTNLQLARKSTEAFLTEYRRYAQILACRRSEEVRKAHSAYEARNRKLREAEGGHAKAVDDLTGLKNTEQQLALNMAAALGRKAALENSPEMRSAKELENARKQAEERRNDTEKLQRNCADASESLDRETAEHGKEVARAADILEQLNQHIAAATKCAADCELDNPHQTAFKRAGMPAPSDVASIDGAEHFLVKALDKRRADARLLRELNGAVETSRRRQQQSFQLRESQAGRVAESNTALVVGENAIVEAMDVLSAAYREWFRTISLLKPSTPDEVLPALRDWSETASAAGPVRAAVDRALDQHRRGAAAERAARSAEWDEHRRSLQALTEEREQLRRGRHQPPPIPHTRDAAARDGRAGAPFWRLCEFVDGVPDEHRVAIEAALESAGVLDAWVYPDGKIVGHEPFDAFLHADGAPPDSASLRDVLRPSLEDPNQAPAVAAEVVNGVLRRIGLGEGAGQAWVDVTGRWRMGVLSGRWAKGSAEHIGQSARDAARRRRLLELDTQVAQVQEAVGVAELAVAQVDERSRLADGEAERAPKEDSIRSTVARRDALREQLDQNQLRLREAEAELARAQEELRTQCDQRDAAAQDLGLHNWIDRLQAFDDALAEYRSSLISLWSSARECVRSAGSVEALRARVERQRARWEQLNSDSRDAAQKAVAAQAHYQTMHQNIGAAVEEVQRGLRDTETHIGALGADQKRNIGELGAVGERIAGLAAMVETLTIEINEETTRRANAIERLLRFARTSLIDITDESLIGVGHDDLSVTAAVELARQIAAALAHVDAGDNAWTTTQRAIYNHIQNLTNALQSHDYRTETITEDDVLVVTASLHNTKRSMRAFAAMLVEEIDNRRSLLTARELALLENYLIQDVAVELSRLIHEADELVANMNRMLLARPNSTGMTLRFRWDPELQEQGPTAFGAARGTLLRDHAAWSPEDRAALGKFLQEQISRVRESAVATTWQEQLSIALDYRAWHSFHVDRKQDGKWVPLTRKTHGTGSGGEKALALTLPQFAAAAAYYDTAAPHAPRLILLDEAFVGIDRDMRGKCMGLLHEFDLDFVMTSEIEWGCYQTMPGLAIYQLIAREGIDAVWASHWIWNGGERVQQAPQAVEEATRASSSHAMFGADAGATDAPR